MSGKKFADAIKKYDRDQLFTPTEALGLVKGVASAKFDETVEIAVRLGVDPRSRSERACDYLDQGQPHHRRERRRGDPSARRCPATPRSG